MEVSSIVPTQPTLDHLAQIWREVVLVDEVGPNDNFFDLGGHSLLATQILARIAKTFRVELPLRTIFECPTITELAVAVEQAQREPSDAPTTITRRASEGEIHQLLDRLDTLSDDELQQLLKDPSLKDLIS